MPPSMARLDRITASGPCSSRTMRNAVRMSGAMKRLILTASSCRAGTPTPRLFQGTLVLPNRTDQSQALVLGDLAVGQYRQRGNAVPHQPRQRRADPARDQQHRGFTAAFLAGHALAEVLMQTL